MVNTATSASQAMSRRPHFILKDTQGSSYDFFHRRENRGIESLTYLFKVTEQVGNKRRRD